MARKARSGIPAELDSIIANQPAVRPPGENDLPETVAAAAPAAEPTETLVPSGPPAPTIGIPGLSDIPVGPPAGGPQGAAQEGHPSGRPLTTATGPSAGGPPPGKRTRADEMAEIRAQLAAAQHQLGLQQRELAFLRAGSTAAPPAATSGIAPAATPPPTPPQIQQLLEQTIISVQNALPFAVRPSDVQLLIEDPEKGAEMLDAALRQMAVHVAGLVLARATALYHYQRNVERTEEQGKATEERLRASFWGANADLQPHHQTLSWFITQVWNEGIRAPENLLSEAARRTRVHLGLAAPAPGTAPAATPGYPGPGQGYMPPPAGHFRPATAEMGGPGGAQMPNGAAKPDDATSMLLRMAAY